jgi:C1A family cysteine protease
MRNIKRYGWKPDFPDHRDLLFQPLLGAAVLPIRVDLRSFCPPVYDQGQLGSCTGNACEAMFRFQCKKQSGHDYEGSRLFTYFNGREAEGSTDTDSGAMIRDVVKAIKDDGICSEQCWPYDISKFAMRAPDPCYAEALKHQSLKYHRIPYLNSMKSCLAQGHPFVFGFSVYESFESPEVARTGIVPMPGPSEQLLGGHAVMAVGYDDTLKSVIVRNSWGVGWGVGGYFWMLYDYISNPNLADDAWVITSEEV